MTSIPHSPAPPVPTSKRWSLGTSPWQAIAPLGPPRARVIIDNDFSGDPDDLVQLVHHLLSPSADIRLVVGSHLREGDPFDPSPHSAENAVAVVRHVFDRMGLESQDRIVAGSNAPLSDRNTPRESAAVDAIISEAMRDDTSPLFYAAGGGLTDLASAYLREPRIAERLTVIWIGGAEHDGIAVPPPDAMPIEYNLLIDVLAAQVVFNDSELRVWQVPRDAYRQCLLSDAELRLRVATTGSLGAYLYAEVAQILHLAAGPNGPAETYAMGDSPLVLLTALQSTFEADPSSSDYVSMPTPAIASDGNYEAVADARPMRVYTRLDTRLMFEDFYLKLSEFGRWQAAND